MSYSVIDFKKEMSSTTNTIEKKITKRVIAKTKHLLLAIRNRYELQMDGIRFTGENRLEDAIAIVKALSIEEDNSEFSIHKRIILEDGDVVILKRLYVIRNGIETKNVMMRKK